MDHATERQAAIDQTSRNRIGFAPALRSRNFRLFWVGQIISTLGTFLQMVAENWLLYQMTGSTFLLGVVGFVGLLPVVPISFLGGVIVDCVSRRKVIIVTQIGLLAQAMAFGLLAVTGHIRVWHICCLDFVLGALYAIDWPARQAFLVEIVSKADQANAVALNSAIFQLSRVIGQAASGALVATIGAEGAMLLNAVTYLAPIASLTRIRVGNVGRNVERAPLGVALSQGISTHGNDLLCWHHQPDGHSRWAASGNLTHDVGVC